MNADVNELEKIEPSYASLKRLSSILKERQVPGFLGFLLDFLDCTPEVIGCVDLAGKQRLFSIITTDMDAAKQVLKINEEIKGSVINIFPLSIMGDIDVKIRAYPDRKDVQPLTNYVSLVKDSPPELDRLVQSIFNKIVLVSDF